MRYRQIIESTNKESTEELLDKYFAIEGEYSIENSGLVNISGACRMIKDAPIFPVKFNTINGNYFYCDRSELTTLEGGPQVITGSFDCSTNKLTTLVGGPKIVDGWYECSDNSLISLEGFPEKIGGICSHSWSLNLPLLRTLQIKGTIYISYFLNRGKEHPVTEIINSCKLKNPDSWRKAAIDAKRALTDAGFRGNAKW
jgi:hypothetical protein